MSKETWEELDRRLIIETPWLTVNMTTVRLPNGQVISDWPIVYMRDYVNVFVINRDYQALILEGYKHGLGKACWQVVGGYLEKGEKPLEAAKRELLEETGYASNDWTCLGSFIVDANRYGGTGYFYLAQDAVEARLPDDGDLEGFDLTWLSINEIREGLQGGRFGILSHAAAVSLSLVRLKSEA